MSRFLYLACLLHAVYLMNLTVNETVNEMQYYNLDINVNLQTQRLSLHLPFIMSTRIFKKN